MDVTPPTTADYASHSAFATERQLAWLIEQVEKKNKAVADSLELIVEQITLISSRIDQIELRLNLGG